MVQPTDDNEVRFNAIIKTLDLLPSIDGRVSPLPHMISKCTLRHNQSNHPYAPLPADVYRRMLFLHGRDNYLRFARRDECDEGASTDIYVRGGEFL